MSFTWETMGEKSGPKVFVRYRENSLYGNSFYGASTVYGSNVRVKCLSQEQNIVVILASNSMLLNSL